MGRKADGSPWERLREKQTFQDLRFLLNAFKSPIRPQPVNSGKDAIQDTTGLHKHVHTSHCGNYNLKIKTLQLIR